MAVSRVQSVSVSPTPFFAQAFVESHVRCGSRVALAGPKGVTTRDPCLQFASSPRCRVVRIPSQSLSPTTPGTYGRTADVCHVSACVPDSQVLQSASSLAHLVSHELVWSFSHALVWILSLHVLMSGPWPQRELWPLLDEPDVQSFSSQELLIPTFKKKKGSRTS